MTNDDLARFQRGSLFVDVSCDEGMGFEWARPTTFAEPMFGVGDGLHYYAVDHSPSFLWNSATWENSEALLEYLPIVMSGPAAWGANETIERAIEIREGVIQNPRIISFQNRSRASPTPSKLRRCPRWPLAPPTPRASGPASCRSPSPTCSCCSARRVTSLAAS